MKRFDGVQPWVDPRQLSAGAELETAQPARSPDLVGDLVVPVGQSVVTGGLLAGGVVVLAALAGWDGEWWRLWAGVAVVVASGAWVLLLMDTRSLLRKLETWTGVDLDRDGQVGEPAERLVFVDRQKAKAEAAEARRADEWGQFLRFVRELEHRGTALAAWEKVIGRERYTTFRDALLDYDLARWRSYDGQGRPNVSQGWELTMPVGDVLSRLRVE
jgi:hypothetical protein